MVQSYTLTIVATGAKGEDGEIANSDNGETSYDSAGGNGAQFTLSYPFDSNFSARKKMALKFINKQGGAGGGGDSNSIVGYGSGGAGGNGVEVNIGVETADGTFQYKTIMVAGGGGGGGAHVNGITDSRGGNTLSYTRNYTNYRVYDGGDGTGGDPGATVSWYRGEGGTDQPGDGGRHGYGGQDGWGPNGGAGDNASHGRFYGGGGGGGGYKGGGGGGDETEVAGGGGAASSYFWKNQVISIGSETYTFNNRTLNTAHNDSNTNNNVKVTVVGGYFAGEKYNSSVSTYDEVDLTSVFKTFYVTASDAVLYTDDTVLSIDLSDYHDPDPDGDTLNYYIQNANNQGGSTFSLSGTSKNLTFTQGIFGFFTSTVQWYTNVTGYTYNSAIKTVTVHHNVTTGYEENGIDLYNLYARGTHVGTPPYSVTTSNYKVNGTDLIDIFERETNTIVNGSSNFIIKDDTNTYRTFDQIFKKM